MKVRIFGYRGVTQMREPMPKQHHSDSILMLEEPYEFSEVLESNGAVPVTSTANIVYDRVTTLKVEVQDGEGIRYEIQPPSGGRVVTENSPRLQGVDFFPFYPGWTLQFIDLASAP